QDRNCFGALATALNRGGHTDRGDLSSVGNPARPRRRRAREAPRNTDSRSQARRATGGEGDLTPAGPLSTSGAPIFQSASATRVPWSIARLASSSTATSAPPISVNAIP